MEGRGMAEERMRTDLPAGRIPMCCWPSSTKLPIGWPSGLYAAPWLTEGSRRKPDCSQNVDMKKGGRGKKKREHTRQSAIVPAPAQTYCKTLCLCLRTALTDAWHANTHTVGPYACKHTHLCLRAASVIQNHAHRRYIVFWCREENMQFDRMRRISVWAGNSSRGRVICAGYISSLKNHKRYHLKSTDNPHPAIIFYHYRFIWLSIMIHKTH